MELAGRCGGGRADVPGAADPDCSADMLGRAGDALVARLGEAVGNVLLLGLLDGDEGVPLLCFARLEHAVAALAAKPATRRGVVDVEAELLLCPDRQQRFGVDRLELGIVAIVARARLVARLVGVLGNVELVAVGRDEVQPIGRAELEAEDLEVDVRSRRGVAVRVQRVVLPPLVVPVVSLQVVGDGHALRGGVERVGKIGEGEAILDVACIIEGDANGAVVVLAAFVSRSFVRLRAVVVHARANIRDVGDARVPVVAALGRLAVRAGKYRGLSGLGLALPASQQVTR